MFLGMGPCAGGKGGAPCCKGDPLGSEKYIFMSAGSKRRADAGVNGESGGGRQASWKKGNTSIEPQLNAEETLQQAVYRLDSVKGCACPHLPPWAVPDARRRRGFSPNTATRRRSRTAGRTLLVKQGRVILCCNINGYYVVRSMDIIL